MTSRNFLELRAQVTEMLMQGVRAATIVQLTSADITLVERIQNELGSQKEENLCRFIK